MKQEDREALRAFYQTLGRELFTDEQVALYRALTKGKDARVNWIRSYGGTVGVPAPILAILASDVEITKADLAVITATAVASKTGTGLSGFVDKVISIITAPIRWLFGG